VLLVETPMLPVSDHELLRRYADHGGDDVFTELRM